MNASIKLQQETQTRAGRRIRAQRTRNNKQKRPALLSLERRDHGQKAKVAKQVSMKTAFQTWLAPT